MLPLAAALALLAAADAAPEAPGDRPTVLALEPLLEIREFLYQGPFQRVTAVHCDAATGEIYAADAVQNVIGIFDERGAPLFAFTDDEHLQEPRRLAVDAKGRIHVLDLDRGKVKIFSYRGDFLEAVDVSAAAGQAVLLTALALDEGGVIWVGDSANGQILAIGPDRKLLRRFGVPGNGPGELGGIAAIALDAKQVYVADQTSQGVQVYSRHGRYLRGWGVHETGKANVSLPGGIAVDASGRIALADTLRQEIKYFEPDGTLIDLFGGFGTGAGEVSYPVDLSIGRDGVLCVAEKGNGRIQLLAPRVGLRSPPPPSGARREAPADRRSAR